MRDPSRRWGIRLDTTFGPWVSLGLHLDFRAPLVDLHLPWLIVSIGRVYAGGRWQLLARPPYEPLRPNG